MATTASSAANVRKCTCIGLSFLLPCHAARQGRCQGMCCHECSQDGSTFSPGGPANGGFPRFRCSRATSTLRSGSRKTTIFDSPSSECRSVLIKAGEVALIYRVAVALAAFAIVPVQAAGPPSIAGRWAHEDGRAIVEFAPCGAKMCGHIRSEERRVGKEGGSTCRSRWSPYH